MKEEKELLEGTFQELEDEICNRIGSHLVEFGSVNSRSGINYQLTAIMNRDGNKEGTIFYSVPKENDKLSSELKYTRVKII